MKENSRLKLSNIAQKITENYDIIIFDFDGVILDSNKIKTDGFLHIFKDFPKEKIDEFLNYHKKNIGLSRNNKINYFFTKIYKLNNITEIVDLYLIRYSNYVYERLTNPSLIIKDTINFVNYLNDTDIISMIVSASNELELLKILKELNLDNNFKGVYGSPKEKSNNILYLLEKYRGERFCLIGDSDTDYFVSKKLNLDFFGYNNFNLKEKGEGYIDYFINMTDNI